MGCSTRLFEKEGWSYHDIRDRTPHFMEISRHQSDVGFNIVCADITINYSSNEGKTHWCGHTDLYFSGTETKSVEHVYWFQKILTLMN